MPQTIIETQSHSQQLKCDVPVLNYVTLEKGSESDSPTGSDSSLNGLFTNGKPSKYSPFGGRETAADKLSLTNKEDNCNRLNDRELNLHADKPLNGAYTWDLDLMRPNEEKGIGFCNGLVDSLPNKPLKSNNMRIVNDTESEILGDFSDLLSSLSSPSMVSNGFSSNSNLHLDEFEAPNSNGFDFVSKNSKPSFKCEDSNSQINEETLSDFLMSISFNETNVMHNGHKPSDSNLFVEDIQIPSMSKLDLADSSILDGYKLQNNGNLSDILLTIDIKEDKPMQSKLNSSLPTSDLDLFFEDMFLGCESNGLKLNSDKSQNNGTVPNFRTPDNKVPISNGINKQTDSERQNRETLSDILSSISCLTEYPTNDTPTVLNSVSNSNCQHELLTSLVDFNVGNHKVPTSRMSVPKPTSLKTTLNNKKNGEYSFFSVSPENVFSDMVSKLKKEVELQDNTTDNNLKDISMLDLFKSVNSDSSSSLSEYLSTESEGSLTDKDNTEAAHDLCEVMDIDLSGCVKTSDDTPNKITNEEAVMVDCTNTRENDHNENQLGSFMIKAFPETRSLKRRRMNLKQGLLAKSLSCKCKKNPVLLQKVARIKSELFEKYFNHPLPSVEAKKNFEDSIISQANNCMVTFNGHHVCTSKGLYDVKES